MQINLNWDTSVSAAPSFFKAAVQQAANLLSATLLNPISVSIQVGWNEDGGTPMIPNSGGLGGDNSAAFANASALSSNNVQAISLLVNQANLNGTPGVVAPLPTSNPFTNGYLILSPAEARIMGVPNPGATTYDGAVGFALPSYTTYNEMVDAALHEIAHALGRINGYEAGGTLWYTPLDLYTYSAPGQLWNPTSSTPGYFSLNGGITNLGTFSGPDPADFANLADPFGYTDTNVTTLSPLDQKVMQTLGFDVATNQPVLAPNTITTTAPNSLFTGSGGDIVTFSDALADYHLSTNPTTGVVTVQDTLPNQDGTSAFLNVARLQFTDTTLAFDLGTTQSTGEAALLLGAALGSQAVNDPLMMSTWIRFFDVGGTLAQAAQSLISSGTISAPDNASFVSAVWQHVVGSPIDSVDLGNFTNALANGTYTQASLLALAAQTTFNQSNIDLKGLSQSGYQFTPVTTTSQGISSVSFTTPSTLYTVTDNPAAGTVTVTGSGTQDTLVGLQQIRFSDQSLAFDTAAAPFASQSAELLVAAYGTSALTNKSLVGTVLGYMDSSGGSFSQAAQSVANLLHMVNSSQFVSTLWQNIVGSPIDPADLNLYTSALSNGIYTQSTLLAAAAQSPVNLSHVTLTGIAQHGLAFA